jgi:DMSO/TMAO reductase YedYZ heme-binding membrane subunit
MRKMTEVVDLGKTVNVSTDSAISRSKRSIIATLCALAAVGACSIISASIVAFPEVDGWHHAARYTARFSFALFLIVFLVRPWHELWRSNATRWMMRNRRALGLAFATAHFIHLYALTRFRVGSEQIPNLGGQLIAGVTAYVLLTAMTVTSNDTAVRTLGPRAWKYLHTVGIYWIWFFFLEVYVTRIASGQLFYIPFALIALAALGLRITARVSRQARRAVARLAEN